MFSVQERADVSAWLVDLAKQDRDVCGAAMVGSAARGAGDRWSDIDVAVQLADGADEAEVVARWTNQVAERFDLIDTVDIHAAGVRYRVFLLGSSLQVDLSFWPTHLFGSNGEPFHLIFGTPREPVEPSSPDPVHLIGMGWLYGLHVRSAVARDRPWQAVIMLDGLRDQVVALTCLRHELPPWQGRGVDELPAGSLAMLQDARAANLTSDELRRSLSKLLTILLDEAEGHAPRLADRLRPVLPELWG